MIVCFSIPAIAVACESARRSDLAGVPFALVADDNTIFVPAPFAAECGVHSGQSLSAARAFCPALVTLPYDLPAYQSRARVLWDIAASESSTVEPVSPELFFLLTDRTFVLSGVEALAESMSIAVSAPVLAGVGTSKFAARRAALVARPGQPHIIRAGEELDALSSVAISEVAGVEAKARVRLEKLGIRTIGQAAAQAGRLPKDLRIVGGRLAALARGLDGERVRAAWPERSEEAETVFEDEVEHLTIVDAALSRLAEKIAEGLQGRHEYCRTLAIQVGYARRVAYNWERLVLPVSDAPAIHRAALRLLERSDRQATECGVVSLRLVAGELGSGSGIQLSLLDAGGNSLPAERNRKTAATLTYIRERWGGGSVTTARALHEETKRSLRAYPLGHRCREAVQVRLHDGVPATFARRKSRHVIVRVQNKWRETDVFTESPAERQVWRVQTAGGALAELHEAGGVWTLQGMAD